MPRAATTPPPAEFDRLGDLIVFKGTDRALGYLVHLVHCGGPDAAFDANVGRVPFSGGEVRAHNRALSKAEVLEIDDRCRVGQWVALYLHEPPRGTDAVRMVTTCNGDEVSRAVRLRHTGRQVFASFRRGAKVFEGRVSQQHNLVRFRRIS